MKTALKPTQWVIFAICIVLMYFNRFIPAFDGLEPRGMSILCITVGSLLLLLGVNMKWGIPLVIMAYPASGIYTVAQIMSKSFGNHLFAFVMFNTMLLFVLKKNGALHRLSVWFISRPFVKKNPWYLIIAFYLTILVLGSVINVTVCAVLFFSLAINILDQVGIKKGDRNATIFMLGTMFCVAFAFGATPIANPTNLNAMAMVKDLYDISIFEFSIIGYPVMFVSFGVFLLLLKFVFRLDASRFANFDASALGPDLGPMKKEEKLSVAIFVSVVVLWVLPDVISGFAPGVASFISGMGVISPAFLGCVLMCIVTVDGKPLMDYYEAMRNSELGAAMLMAASMGISAGISDAEAGLPAWIGSLLGPAFSGLSPFAFIFVITMIAAIMTNFCSCSLTVTVVLSVGLPLVLSGAVTGVNAGILGTAVGYAASVTAFMTPPGGTIAAVLSGLDWVPSKDQLIHGAIYTAIFGVIIVVGTYLMGTAFVF